jgi:hypothetical protein
MRMCPTGDRTQDTPLQPYEVTASGSRFSRSEPLSLRTPERFGQTYVFDADDLA